MAARRCGTGCTSSEAALCRPTRCRRRRSWRRSAAARRTTPPRTGGTPAGRCRWRAPARGSSPWETSTSPRSAVATTSSAAPPHRRPSRSTTSRQAPGRCSRATWRSRGRRPRWPRSTAAAWWWPAARRRRPRWRSAACPCRAAGRRAPPPPRARGPRRRRSLLIGASPTCRRAAWVARRPWCGCPAGPARPRAPAARPTSECRRASQPGLTVGAWSSWAESAATWPRAAWRCRGSPSSAAWSPTTSTSGRGAIRRPFRV
mmetsp:Transcript_63353/g.164645  ORF Transcript_63353/g.164645 Transcript_63353/m.164645 type:complete len:260 (+) Transcript_63353:526-1305(+)